ncbi:hypothetical protein CEP53_007694 [Fusarium sp. AF-6]|nr:hypothetical protein CEP53_007694 [Fusarium sp. AF-6]
MEPWEIEEFYALYQFVCNVYQKIFAHIYWDLHPDNPRFNDQGRPPTPDGAFDLDSLDLRNNYLEGTTLHGLTFLRTVLFQITDDEILVSTMQKRIRSSHIPIGGFHGMFDEMQQMTRRQHQPSERDQMEADRVPLVFVRDEINRPPRAWTMIWGDTYSNIYGATIPDELRDWGYVFWDEATLERVGGVKMLRSQLERDWGDVDPRDFFI